MSISRISKLNGVATQLHQKPADCGYGRKKIPFEQRLEEADKVDEWNERITEVTRELPNNQEYRLLRKVFIECGLRKES